MVSGANGNKVFVPSSYHSPVGSKSSCPHPITSQILIPQSSQGQNPRTLTQAEAKFSYPAAIIAQILVPCSQLKKQQASRCPNPGTLIKSRPESSYPSPAWKTEAPQGYPQLWPYVTTSPTANMTKNTHRGTENTKKTTFSWPCKCPAGPGHELKKHGKTH